MIEFENLTYTYPSAPLPALRDVSLEIEEGAFVLVVGRSGAGKSTLLRCLNGLVPHFYGGTISGHVRVAGQDPVALEPRRMSQTVGFVFQDPEAQAVVDVVENELAFAMENQGISQIAMRKRVEEVLDQLNIASLRRRQISTLSGGERQRVAIASVLTLHPQVLVLDEPTSQLDPQAAEDVLDTLVKLNHDLGLTILLSEHRLERVAQYADQILYLPGRGEPPVIGEPSEILSRIPLVPPLVELGKRLGWSPLPLSIKEAWRSARQLQSELEASATRTHAAPKPQTEAQSADAFTESALEIRRLTFAYDGQPTLRGIDLTVRRGEFVAIVGRNGAGKSTLLKQCIGLLKPHSGRVSVLGLDTRHTAVEELARHVGYVPQNPNALLFADTVSEELAFTRRAQGLPLADEGNSPATETEAARLGSTRDQELLLTLGLGGMEESYPRDLSVGERQRVALASVLVGDPDLILLDEPTRGLDYAQKAALISALRALQRRGATIVLVTHDVELVAQCAARVVLLGDGEIVVDGPVRQVMSDSQVFSSQINKLLRDPRYLTVEDVLADMP